MNLFQYPKTIEKWDVFEISCRGKSDQNPFTDYTIRGEFSSKNETITVDGFVVCGFEVLDSHTNFIFCHKDGLDAVA